MPGDSYLELALVCYYNICDSPINRKDAIKDYMFLS
jgi:hypothetical protein